VPRRVAIVSPDPSNQAGGVERVCALLGEALEGQGWEAEIVGPTHAPTRWQSRLGLNYPLLSRSATAATRARRDLDLIVTNGFLGLGCPPGVPRIHLYHGTMVGNAQAQRGSVPTRERLRRTVGAGLTEALSGRRATRVACVSDLVAEEVLRRYRLRADAVIPNGIDTATFAPREMHSARERLGLSGDRRYALFVGRLEHGKGSDLVVEGAARGGYELLIAGPTAAPGARHLGVLAPAALAEAYGAADCVLFPSRYEGCSLVVLEALACGRPLLTTRVGWMGTLLRAVPAYDALCIEPAVEQIAARLRAMTHFDSSKPCAAARAFVLANNSLERWAARWGKLIEELQGVRRSSAAHRLPMAQ
jgi:glycosyltransferase involved in cell wall biosynthesis